MTKKQEFLYNILEQLQAFHTIIIGKDMENFCSFIDISIVSQSIQSLNDSLLVELGREYHRVSIDEKIKEILK